MKLATQYIQDVLSGKEVCCQFVKQAVQRHISDLEKSKDSNYPFVFSEQQANRALAFVGMLRHTEGKLAGERFNIQPNQAFAIAMIYGWRDRETGLRRFTQAYIEMARKGGKSQLAAAFELYGGGFEGEEGAQVFTAATTSDQAGIVFRAAKKMARYLKKDSPALNKVIDIYAHSVNFKNTDSFIQKVSADHGTLDGLNPYYAIIDEYHAHKTDMVKGVMQTGMGSRECPLLLIITTAGFDKDSPCFTVERANAAAVLSGDRRQDNLFALIFTLDEGDKEALMEVDLDSKEGEALVLTLSRKSNPNLGSTPTEKYILDQVRDAKNKGTSTRVQVLTKNFNCWLDTPTIWIPDENVRGVMRRMTIDEFEGRPCYMGIDLASTADVTALDLTFPEHDGKPAAGISYFFLPEATIEKRRADVAYADWVERGFIIPTPGNIADYAFLKKKILELSEIVQVKHIKYDQWNAYQLVTELTEYGFEMSRCMPNYSDLSEPCKKIEKMILSGAIELDENPVLLWMFRNVVLDYDPNDNIKPNKKRSPDKIDGVMAKAMAFNGWLSNLAKPVSKSYLFDDETDVKII